MGKLERDRETSSAADSAEPARGFRPGLVLDGRYRLDRPLGQGGMGMVWLGHQITLEREVAIKSLRVVDAPSRARLQREALALAAVHHPAIVEVFDYGETAAGLPYIVMELVRGEGLDARLASRGALDAREAVGLVLTLLEGLAVAHRAGIVHRDIKPSNVVLASRDGVVAPRLIDFGIAYVEPSTGRARLTHDGGAIGTPTYMAPEQIRGVEADARVDVWGIAVLLYELIAGAPPFPEDDVLVVMRRVLDDPPPYPRTARGLDGALWSILMCALRKAPDERTPSVEALHAALAAWRAARVDAAAGLAATRPFVPPRSEPAPASDPPDGPGMDALIRRKLGDR